MSHLGPFRTGEVDGHPVGHTDAASRIEAVKRFDWDECEAALQVPGIQAGVVKAIGRRMRALQRAGQSPRTAGSGAIGNE